MAKLANDRTIVERISKLPEWVRDYIRDLQLKLGGALKSLEEVRQTRTEWGWPMGLEHGRAHGYIPDDEPVRFYLGQEEHKDKWVEIRRDKGKLLLYGSHGFVMGTTSSNRMLLTVDRKGEYT